jgi:hypothetical protein
MGSSKGGGGKGFEVLKSFKPAPDTPEKTAEREKRINEQEQKDRIEACKECLISLTPEGMGRLERAEDFQGTLRIRVERLREARQAAGLTGADIEALAKKMGILEEVEIILGQEKKDILG